MGLSDGRKGFQIGLAVLIQYRSVTDTQPPSHVAVAITLYAVAPSANTVDILQIRRLTYFGHVTHMAPWVYTWTVSKRKTMEEVDGQYP